MASRGTLAPKLGAGAGAGNRGFAGAAAPNRGFAGVPAPNAGFADAETPNRGFAGEPTLMAGAIGAFGSQEAAVLSCGSPIEAAFCRLRTLKAVRGSVAPVTVLSWLASVLASSPRNGSCSAISLPI
jgi:hypothetical protein